MYIYIFTLYQPPHHNILLHRITLKYELYSKTTSYFIPEEFICFPFIQIVLLI